MTIALDDLMGRYTPPVPHSVYHLSFVPVAIDQSNKKEHDDSGVGMDLVLEEGAAAAVSCSRGILHNEILLKTLFGGWTRKKKNFTEIQRLLSTTH